MAKAKTFTASDGVSTVPEPAGGKDNSRPADRTGGETAIPTFDNKGDLLAAIVDGLAGLPTDDIQAVYHAMVNDGKVSVNRASITAKPSLAVGDAAIKEGLEDVLTSLELDAEVKEKTATLFENAVSMKVATIKATLEEEYEAKLEAETVTMQESLDTYLTYVAKEFMAENAVAIQTGLKTELVESFIGGMHTLFKEHYIDVPEDKLDVLATMAEQVASLENKLNESINTNISLSTIVESMEVKAKFKEMCEGLTLTQVEKLKLMSEGLEYNDLSDFETKIKMIKESNFSTTATVTPTTTTTVNDLIHESVTTPEEQTVPSMQDIVSFMSKHKLA